MIRPLFVETIQHLLDLINSIAWSFSLRLKLYEDQPTLGLCVKLHSARW